MIKIVFDEQRMKPLVEKQRDKEIESLSNKDEALELKKLQNKKKRFKQEVATLHQNIADVETQKITGQQKKEIAERILENLNSLLKEKENQISKCQTEIDGLKNKNNWIKALKAVKYDKNCVEIDIDPKKMQPAINRYIERIDAYYHEKLSEHELVLHFKFPLYDGRKQETLKLKKKQKNLNNESDTHYPLTKQERHSRINQDNINAALT